MSFLFLKGLGDFYGKE